MSCASPKPLFHANISNQDPKIMEESPSKKYQIINPQSHLKATIHQVATSASRSKLLAWNCVYALLVLKDKKYLLAKALL